MISTGTLVAPSLLSADFGHFAAAVRKIRESGGDWVHLDVMDGSFVPNITFGPKLVADIRGITDLPLDVHLMIVDPERHIPAFAAAGSDYITVHLEACVHTHRVIELIRSEGRRPGISIVPSTPAADLSEVLAWVDLVLVMTVDPGFGGQAMIPSCVEKIRAIRRLREESGLNFLIAADGGVNAFTAGSVRDAGADVLVAGSAFFRSEDPAREVAALRGNVVV